MKKLYICEYPYVLYKALVERMGDDQNAYSLILSDATVDLSPMTPVLRQSGLFDQVEFFPSMPYRDYYNLYFFNLPQSWIRKNLVRLKNLLILSMHQKEFKKINFPFAIDFQQYGKIICTDLPCVINGYLSMNHIEYAACEHARFAYMRSAKSVQYATYLFVLGILDKLRILNGISVASKFCKEVIVDNASNMSWCIYDKKVTIWDVAEHINALSAQQKDCIFQLYAQAYGVKINTGQTYDLLLTNPLYKDAYLPSEEKQIQFYKDVIRDYFHFPALIKPHPRDTVDYKKFFPECIVIDQNIPSEVLNFSQNLKLGTVFTLFSSSGTSFQEKAEKLIVLEDSQTAATHTQLESLKAYR